MAGPVSKVGWKIVGGAATVAGGTAATKSVNAVYRKVRGGEPPKNLAHPDTTWREAMFFALLTAVAVALGRLAAERVVATGWTRLTGALPPGMEGRAAAASTD
ncbi:DUF4235 domain-containing protein [Pseudofrankia asymbiotica]|uniref:DUF4235 domain-containing protein n=1 Tax=Pseudofrankia asymbiotica TaxID=1834516 RepID=A0A1V2IB66_9ACTN|nr:DUF4235 domain-containing protein [Pseudofrankia asymbiotica]ONH30453.1 hypothetical protein BL253_14005 [Pseudofrankia asymbiotica]